jgi:hypothetical protein
VRLAGLEPARVAPLPPQSSASANSAISATGLVLRRSPVLRKRILRLHISVDFFRAGFTLHRP